MEHDLAACVLDLDSRIAAISVQHFRRPEVGRHVERLGSRQLAGEELTKLLYAPVLEQLRGFFPVLAELGRDPDDGVLEIERRNRKTPQFTYPEARFDIQQVQDRSFVPTHSVAERSPFSNRQKESHLFRSQCPTPLLPFGLDALELSQR
ncbi:MAG TPA: hypothetical protein PLU87_18145 [Sedimentisphaerales bacterium]|nr:hypothetical protein [Sedimentisphaerales bacterium]